MRASSNTLKYAKVERERRFLLPELPTTIDASTGYRQFEDLYLPATCLRIRRVTAPDGAIVELKLNHKRPHEPPLPTHRITTSIYLSQPEYDLLSSLEGFRVVKRRYAFPWGGVVFGVDIFLGALCGLVLAEAEAASEAALASTPEPPGRYVEVSADPLFCGGSLATGDARRILERARELLAT